MDEVSYRNSADRTDQSVRQADIPHQARIYNYLLGGNHHFAGDRNAAEEALAVFPDLRIAARENRAFLRRATRFAALAGVRQFLEIGAGIPTAPALHEIAQQIAPDSRVLYVDNEPMFFVQVRDLLVGTEQGKVSCLEADLRDPERILSSSVLRETLDLTRPVALSLLAVLHFLEDDDDPYGIVERLLTALPSGSYLTISHPTGDFEPTTEALGEKFRSRGISARQRDRTQVAGFFRGLEFVDPGLVPIHTWRPDDPILADVTEAAVSIYGAVACKP
ncbi:MAG TPA: SAM-dependent methyltransferase [Amycolatopsis sp.]|uniref:SAM-dependent methyltransferase n=1 Tax=Amycolatopsis sp. TaxID=37632 RepID=UPI002B468BAA|nr:SAM-dependent methyltransferase [Amycolatopsis sp.]HKS46592.1 SAM-dependent methyltransferase [Amycolatopsis sp.]